MKTTGIIKEIGDLSPDTIITEAALAELLGKHPVSIRRAIGRGELPRSIRMFGERVWTVAVLREHINHRLAKAQQDAEQLRQRIAQLT